MAFCAIDIVSNVNTPSTSKAFNSVFVGAFEVEGVKTRVAKFL